MNKIEKKLSDLKNVGKSVVAKLHLLGITTVKQLEECDPTELYLQLEDITGTHHSYCLWDVFAAIINEAQTGQATEWHAWTHKRKERYKNQPLCCCK